MPEGVGPMAEMGAPDFSGAPTEAKRIANGGWADKDQPTGKTLPPAPMASDDPDSN